MKPILFLLLMTLASAMTSAQEKKITVAVLEFQSTGDLEKKEVSTLSNRFRGMLVKTKAFEVLEREKMNEVLKSQDFNMSDACNTAECAVQVGQLLGVEAMIAGDVGKIGETYTIDLRMIDVQTGKIMQTQTQDYQGRVDGLLGVMGDIANLFASLEGLAATEKGDLYLTSIPPKAEIYLDGKKTEWVTPKLLEGIAVGKHMIELRGGGLMAQKEVEVKKGSMENVELKLAAITASVKIVTEPLEAAVFIDHIQKGKTPLVATLPVGKHTIKITKSGYADHTEELMLKESPLIMQVSVTMKKVFKLSMKAKAPKKNGYKDPVFYVNDKVVDKKTSELPEGKYKIRITSNSPDITEYAEEIVLNSDKNIDVKLDFTDAYKEKMKNVAGAEPPAVSKPMNKKMWYIIGGAAVVGGGVAVLLSGGKDKKDMRITVPELPGDTN